MAKCMTHRPHTQTPPAAPSCQTLHHTPLRHPIHSTHSAPASTAATVGGRITAVQAPVCAGHGVLHGQLHARSCCMGWLGAGCRACLAGPRLRWPNH